jgi:hypothetical protein
MAKGLATPQHLVLIEHRLTTTREAKEMGRESWYLSWALDSDTKYVYVE